jgi:hypothetical protein
VLGSTREYPEVLGSARECSEVLGNAREFYQILDKIKKSNKFHEQFSKILEKFRKKEVQKSNRSINGRRGRLPEV